MWIDLGMTKLFQLAEYICNKTSCPAPEQSLEPSDTEPIIRFPNVGKVVEGDLFGF